MEKTKSKFNYKLIFLISCMAMMLPSVMYLCKNKTIINFSEWFTFFLHQPSNYIESISVAIIFGMLIIILMYFYFKILKNSQKEFDNIKSILLYVLIISLIFGIMIPFTTSDIFYYMGTGWIDSHYGQNPYYITVRDIRIQNPNDEILQRTGVWENQVVVYGPLWAFLCKILSLLSFGNVTWCLYIYKFAAIIIHILNTILVYKITKSKKFALLYGINPSILFEMITNVHNDIYLIFFVLLSLYFLLKRKNIILTIIFMAMATCVKYVSVLLIPFMVLWYLKDKKMWEKIFYSFIYAMIFITIMFLIYLLYAKDITMFFTMTMQQGKYREGIQAIILEISSKTGINFLQYGKLLFIIIFLLVAIDGIIYMFVYNKKTFSTTIRKYNNLLMAFLFLIITNLCPWYTSWLIPTIFWLKSKDIKNVLYIQFSYELVTTINFALHSESYKIGLYYLPAMFIIITIFNIIDKIANINRVKIRRKLWKN